MAYMDPARYLRESGEEFRLARKARGLSREELAELAGVHVNSIGIAERGDHDQNVMTRTLIYAGLGCNHTEIDRKCFAIRLDTGSGIFPHTEILAMPLANIASYIGQAIRTDRIRKGLTLRELSRASGVHLNTLWSIERGLVSAGTFVLYRIFSALEIRALRTGSSGLKLQ